MFAAMYPTARILLFFFVPVPAVAAVGNGGGGWAGRFYAGLGANARGVVVG